MHDLITLPGSFVIGLAAMKSYATPAELWELSRLDERYQQEQWGLDEEAEDMARIKGEAFEHAHDFFQKSRKLAPFFDQWVKDYYCGALPRVAEGKFVAILRMFHLTFMGCCGQTLDTEAGSSCLWYETPHSLVGRTIRKGWVIRKR